MRRQRHCGPYRATRCIDCGKPLGPSDKYGRRCREDYLRHKRERYHLMYPDAAYGYGSGQTERVGGLGVAPGLETWEVAKGEPAELSAQKHLRARVYQAAIAEGRPVEHIPRPDNGDERDRAYVWLAQAMEGPEDED